MLGNRPQNSSAVRLAVLTPIPVVAENSSSPSPPSSNSSRSSTRRPTPPRSQPPTPTRPRSRTHRYSATRPRASSSGMPYAGGPAFLLSSASGSASTSTTAPVDPGSPPPYTPEPDPSAAVFPKRAASSPHLQLHALGPPSGPSPSSSAPHVYPHSHASSRRPSTSALHAHGPAPGARHRAAYARAETDEDDDGSDASGDERVTYQSTGPSLAGTLRERLFGKGKGRADAAARVRPITTAPGVVGAGETETEGEDPPRNLPTARLTPASSLSALSPLSESMSIPIPSPHPHSHGQSFISLGPLLFEFSRLLSIVPALFGTLWNLYHVWRPPNGSWGWRAEYAVSVLWSLLTGWQCLQLTTGLLKRWRAYYSPLPTLIRLLALQAICWPATQLTLTVLDHDARPLVCWAAIGTTTCCSRAVQMWVTSNIAAPHAHADGRRSRRRWDGPAVVRACVLPACAVYVVMAWAAVLRREWGAC